MMITLYIHTHTHIYLYSGDNEIVDVEGDTTTNVAIRRRWSLI